MHRGAWRGAVPVTQRPLRNGLKNVDHLRWSRLVRRHRRRPWGTRRYRLPLRVRLAVRSCPWVSPICVLWPVGADRRSSCSLAISFASGNPGGASSHHRGSSFPPSLGVLVPAARRCSFVLCWLVAGGVAVPDGRSHGACSGSCAAYRNRGFPWRFGTAIHRERACACAGWRFAESRSQAPLNRWAGALVGSEAVRHRFELLGNAGARAGLTPFIPAAGPHRYAALVCQCRSESSWPSASS